jgi:transglutaminase-like putative cysteine protease
MCIGCVAIAAAALVMAARAASSDEGPAAPAAPSKRTFKFTYSVKIPVPADGSKLLEAWIPVPQSDDLQTVSDLKVEASVPHTVETEPEYGNKMAHVRIENPKAEVSLSWSAVIVRAADVGQGKGAVHPRFTQADKLVPLDGKAAQMATELGVKTGGTVRERAQKIYDNVLHTMFYDKVAEGWGKGDFDRACTVGKGNCTDFHAKFIGIGRAAGIPVRFTMGVPLSGDPKGLAGGYHCWAHFYDGAAWIPVDISEAQKLLEKDPAKAAWFFGNLDPDRVTLSVGRDVNLAPKQQGSALLFFIYPYVEVDGKKIDLPKEARTFAFENVGS